MSGAMRRGVTMRRSLLLVPLVALLLAADAKDDAVAKDKAALKGKWRMVAAEDWNGEKIPDDVAKMYIYTFTDDKVIAKVPDAKEDEGSYTIDPAKSPKQIDMAF